MNGIFFENDKTIYSDTEMKEKIPMFFNGYWLMSLSYELGTIVNFQVIQITNEENSLWLSTFIFEFDN